MPNTNLFTIYINLQNDSYRKQEKPIGKFTIHKWKPLEIDSIFFYYLNKELQISQYYRLSFVRNQASKRFQFILNPTQCDLIDYQWNNRVYEMVRERCELDHALSWLSTLGGAFSALGDYFENCAEMAGKISMNQFHLALRLGDPNITARCRLYFSLSLIQKQLFKEAKLIILREFHLARTSPVVDKRLINMCKGIWSKLQYEYGLFKRNRKKNNIRKL